MKSTFKRCILLGMSSSLLGMFSATAANSFYQAGDLVLYFQKLSGSAITNTVYVGLGAATGYRGSAIGANDVATNVNFLNINSTLTSAFGSGWATDPGIYAGLAGIYSAVNNNSVVNGDISRTLYVSVPRNTVGTVGSEDSTAWEFTTSTPFTTAAGKIQQQNNLFGDSSDTNGFDGQALVVGPSVSLIDDNNPITVFSGVASQGLGFEAFDGGVQQVGTSGVWGDMGTGPLEFALDLNRIVPTNGRAGEINGNIDGATRKGSYEGTVAVGSDGGVSFITGMPTAVPEPSSLALSGLAVGALMLRRRRTAR